MEKHDTLMHLRQNITLVNYFNISAEASPAIVTRIYTYSKLPWRLKQLWAHASASDNLRLKSTTLSKLTLFQMHAVHSIGNR